MRSSRQTIAAASAGLILGLILLPVGPARGADESSSGSLKLKDLDAQIYQTVRGVINDGADIHNKPTNDPAGCARFFQGSLKTFRPLLGHHPELQKAIDKGLAEAKAMPNGSDQAWRLYEVLDKIKLTVAPPPAIATGVGKTLWERLGGQKNVETIVDEFIDAAIADSKVNFFRNGKFKKTPADIEAMKKQFVALTSEVSGGPLKYKGQNMRTAHKEMEITDEEFSACLSHLTKAMLKNHVKPADVAEVKAMVELTRRDIVTKRVGPVDPKPAATLWDRMGGQKNVEKIVDEFLDAAIADPKVNFTRGGKFKWTPDQIADLKKHIVALASLVSAGPLKYDGRPLAQAHKDMNITNDELDAFLSHLKIALLNNGVKADDVDKIMKLVDVKRKDIVTKSAGPGDPKPASTLWERLGGEKNVTKIADEFIDAAIADPKVNFTRGGKFKWTPDQIADLKKHFVALASEVSEGPLKYEGPTLAQAQALNLNITNDEFDAFVGHLKNALKKNDVKPEDADRIMKVLDTGRKELVK